MQCFHLSSEILDTANETNVEVLSDVSNTTLMQKRPRSPGQRMIWLALKS